MFKYGVLIVIISLTYFTGCQAQSYDDKRCKCICPSISSVLNTTNTTNSSNKRLNFISNVQPSLCNCDGVILPKIKNELNGQELIFCPRCECKYENRNTTIIKIVVIIVIWVISLLVIYMLILICLEPLVNKRIPKSTSGGGGYQEHTNEDDETIASSTVGTSSHPMGVRSNVLNRVGHQQDKWKRQVREQRRNIYDRHTMLN